MTQHLLLTEDFGSIHTYRSEKLSRYLDGARLMGFDHNLCIVPNSCTRTERDFSAKYKKRLFYIDYIAFPSIDSRVSLCKVAFAYQNHHDRIVRWLLNDPQEIYLASKKACRPYNIGQGVIFFGLYLISIPVSIICTTAMIEKAKSEMYKPTPMPSLDQLRQFVDQCG